MGKENHFKTRKNRHIECTPIIRTSRSEPARTYSGFNFNHLPLRSPGSHFDPRSLSTTPSSLSTKKKLDWKLVHTFVKKIVLKISVLEHCSHKASNVLHT